MIGDGINIAQSYPGMHAGYHVVTCSVSDLSVTTFIGFRSDINWLIRSLSKSLCSLCILLFLALLYFQHTNVSRASIRCHPSGNQLTTLHREYTRSSSSYPRERDRFYKLANLIRHDQPCSRARMKSKCSASSLSIAPIMKWKRCTEVFHVHAETHEQDIQFDHTARWQTTDCNWQQA